MNSRDYWKMRSAQDIVDRMGTAEQTAAEMNRAIQQSSDYIAKEVKAVFRGMESFGISESEARKILNAAGDKTALQNLRAAANRVSDPEKRQALLSAIDSAGAYRYRITRLEQLNKDINRECRKLYQTENRAVTSALKTVANDSYYHSMFNIQQETGLGFSFAKFSQRDVDRILRANWLGGNYSQCIWRDVSATAESMKKELLVSMLSGRSNEKTARIIRERFGVNAYCARRIVRTESAYVANAAQMSAYDEAGVDKYRFIATLDSRTSEVCAALDGKVFPAKDALPGTNYPPMHPFCRSTTIAEFGEDALAGMERRARDEDGNTVKVSADMGYEDWYRRFVENRTAAALPDGSPYDLEYRKPRDPCAKGHYFTVKSETAPTCTDEGRREKVCAVCGKVEVETIPATGHSYVETVVPPTCTEKGYTLHKCSKCGDSYQDAETQPLGHDYKAVKTVQPTCVDKGFTEYRCARCGDTYTEEIPATGHKFGKYKIVTKPTSVSEGLKARYCTVCGASDEVVIPKTKTVTKAEKKQKLLDIIDSTQQDIDKIAKKQYNNIWKNPVTVADYSAKQGAIQAKKDYFNQQLALNPADKAKWEALLNDLADFEVQGKKYAALQATVDQAQSQLAQLTAKKGGAAAFASDAYSQSRKNAALWAKNTADADKALRSDCGTVWRNAPACEKDAVYEYTQSYSKFNEPLRGIEYGTNAYKGVGNIDFDQIGVDYAGFSPGEIHKQINDMTNIISKSTYNFDMWVQRGCGYGGMDKFFGISSADLHSATQQQLEKMLLNKEVTEYAFCSCGVSKGKGFSHQPIILNIYAPSGTQMMYAEPFSAFGSGSGHGWDGLTAQKAFGSEAEIILQQGTKFRITKVERTGGKLFVDLDVIGQKPQY